VSILGAGIIRASSRGWGASAFYFEVAAATATAAKNK